MRSRLLIAFMITGVFTITAGLYIFKVRYPISLRIPVLFKPTTSASPVRNMTSSSTSAVSLSQFLTLNKSKFLSDLAKDGASNWTVVMGNEAGDLDSAASSIAYSFLSQPSQTIALLQTSRDDLALRPENVYAFHKARLSPNHEDLLCMDDLPIPPSELRSSFALVDHNRLVPTFTSSDAAARPEKVVGIIDHHADEGLYKDANPRVIITPAGSCASLVAKHFKDAWDKLSPPPEVASLLVAAVLVDTNGLKEGGKAEPIDREYFDFLLSKSSFAPPSGGDVVGDTMTIEQLTQVLRYEKENVTHLSTRDLLRRDYKQYVWGNPSSPINGGLSTVPLSLEDWLEKDPAKTFLRALDAWAKERNLDVVGILNTYKSKKKGKHRREILVYVTEKGVGVKEKLWKGLQEDPELELERLTLADVTSAKDDSSNLRAWDQGNNKATRKVIAPTFERIFKQ